MEHPGGEEEVHPGVWRRHGPGISSCGVPRGLRRAWVVDGVAWEGPRGRVRGGREFGGLGERFGGLVGRGGAEGEGGERRAEEGALEAEEEARDCGHCG